MNALAEARFHGARFLRVEYLRIVRPHETIASKFSWMRFTELECAINETALAELIAASFLRSRWAGFVAWLRNA